MAKTPKAAASPPKPVARPESPTRLSDAEKNMAGGEAPSIWPCSDGKTPESCSHEGVMLKGTVISHDESGGQGGNGFLDVEKESGGIVRFYLNSNAVNVLKTAMSRAGLASPERAQIAARFDGFVKTKRGMYVRTYSIGLAGQSGA